MEKKRLSIAMNRARLNTDFIEALSEDFAENGAQTIRTLRAVDPAAYLRIVASFTPKQVVQVAPEHELSDEELNEKINVLAQRFDDLVRPPAPTLAPPVQQFANRDGPCEKDAPGAYEVTTDPEALQTFSMNDLENVVHLTPRPRDE